MGTSQAAKAVSHDRILDIASARIRRDGIDNLRVAELMEEAGLTTGGFYRHFDSREQLVAEATQRAMSQGSEWTVASGQVGGQRGYSTLVDGYLNPGIGITQRPAAVWPPSQRMPPAVLVRPDRRTPTR